MKYLKTVLIITCMLFTMTVLFADKAQQITLALESTKNVSVQSSITENPFTTISKAKVYEGSLEFAIEGSYGNISMTKYILVDEGIVTFFDTKNLLFSSQEFLSSIRTDFHLKSIEDGLLFQEFLYAVDNEYFNEGFFFEGNSWIFVRDEFFGDIEAWIIETDEQGVISSISYEYDAEIEMPDTMYKNMDMGFAYDEMEQESIEDDLLAQIEENLNQDFVYEIETSPITSRWLKQLSKASWYNSTISIIEEYDGMISTSFYDLIVLEIDGEYSFFEDSTTLITSTEFLSSIKENFLLIDELSKEDFELALDQISDFDRTEKASFERNGEWVFIRSESFDEGRGFIVKTDDNGNITNIEYSYEIPLEGVEVAIEEPFDESNVTWTFDLIEPESTTVHIKATGNVPVLIEFNEWASNKVGAWIGTFLNDEFIGMYAGTTINSPFGDTIPGENLDSGENVISYRLLRPGNDYDAWLGRIDISVWKGEPFDETTAIWTFNLIEPESTTVHIKSDGNVPVLIEFNEWASNQLGAWIGTFLNDEFIGMYASTTINNPFEDTIPGEYLDSGENVVSYRLLRPGRDYDSWLGRVDISVWVED